MSTTSKANSFDKEIYIVVKGSYCPTRSSASNRKDEEIREALLQSSPLTHVEVLKTTHSLSGLIKEIDDLT